jgi:colanic acid biosynthesis glycosyl transferase WcaI
MRILYLGINYWPDESGIAPFATGRCEYLAECGHEVVACTGLPYYPQWRVAAAYRRRLLVREERAGVSIRRSWMYVPRKLTALRRMVHEGTFVCSSFMRALCGPRPDLLLVVSPPLGLAASAIALGRLWRVPYVLHVTDLQPDAAVDLGMLAHGRLVRAFYRLEAAAYRHAAMVSTLSEAMRGRIIAKRVPPEKVVLFSDWVEPALFKIPPPPVRADRGSAGEFVVAHFGNMGVKQGLEIVVEAARLSAAEKAITYLLVGDGAARANVQVRAGSLGLSNLHFLPFQPRERFFELLTRANVCLVTQRRTVADVVFPSKVLTLLAAARPVIASVGADSEVSRVIAESGAGMTIAPEDPRALADAVATLRANPLVRERMGRAGRVYARERWEREGVLKSTEQRLAALVGGAQEAASGSPAINLRLNAKQPMKKPLFTGARKFYPATPATLSRGPVQTTQK